eukprot:610024-Rhodomonas_salina.2
MRPGMSGTSSTTGAAACRSPRRGSVSSRCQSSRLCTQPRLSAGEHGARTERGSGIRKEKAVFERYGWGRGEDRPALAWVNQG